MKKLIAKLAEALTVLSSLLLGSVHGQTSSTLDDDEHLILFDVSGRYMESLGKVDIVIHGWVFEPYLGQARLSLIKQALESHLDKPIEGTTEQRYESITRPFLVDNERLEKAAYRIEGYPLLSRTTKPNGHFKHHIRFRRDKDKLGRELKLEFEHPKIDYKTSAVVHVVRPGELLVISDIDDTVKISEVLDKKALLENTFLNPFVAVPGMAELYQTCYEKGANFIFVSSSPWQLYTALQEFFDTAGFPPRSMSLKNIRFKDSTLLNLFKPGTATKPIAIENILKRFPDNDIVLIGDSGEQDPLVYQIIAKRHPKRIKAIFIREVMPVPEAERIDSIVYFKEVKDIESKLLSLIK